MTANLDWMADAKCVGHPNPDIFFPSAVGLAARKQTNAAERICATCPVVAQCREHKRRTGAASGVWGGRKSAAKATSTSSGGPQCSTTHGTEAAAKRHRRRGEKPCPPCLDAERRARTLRGWAS